MKKGAIFDMDGLLVDSERMYQQIWIDQAHEMGVELSPDFVKEVSGTNGVLRENIINKHFHTDEGKAIVAENLKRGKEKLQKHVPLKTGVREILKFFYDRGIKIAVASSNYEDQIRSNLEKSGIAPYFDAIVSGSEITHGKPAPDIFLKAAEKLELDPRDCYVFEDSLNGIRAAHTAECAPVMIPDMMEPTEEIQEICHGIFPDMLKAIEFFRKEQTEGN